MFNITAKTEDGREITCALLEARSRCRYGNGKSAACSTFQDVNDGELYQYNPDDDVFVRPKRMVLFATSL